MTAFMPGASPPLVRTPMLRITGPYCLLIRYYLSAFDCVMQTVRLHDPFINVPVARLDSAAGCIIR